MFLFATAVWLAFPLPFYAVNEYYTRKYSPMIYEAIHDADMLYNGEHIVSLNVVGLESLEYIAPENSAIDFDVFKRKRTPIHMDKGFKLVVLLITRGWHDTEDRERTAMILGFDFYCNENKIRFDEMSSFSGEQNYFDSMAPWPPY